MRIPPRTLEPIDELPGVFRYSIDTLLDQVTKASDLGITCVIPSQVYTATGALAVELNPSPGLL